MKPWITTALVILAGGSATCDPLPEAIPNYMFSAILGSGYYQVEDASLAVVRIPFSLHLQETTLEQAGLRLLLPITIGYASLDPDDNIERWLPTKFGSLSFIPGIEYRKRLGDHHLLKPFAQIGGGYNFNNNIASGLIVGGARTLSTFHPNNQWQIQLGSSIQWATEWKQADNNHSHLGLFELGADFRRELPFCLGERKLNGSIYCRWRYFFNDWNIADTREGSIHINHYYEVGLSLGVEEGISMIGIPINRVSIGWITNNELHAFTLGTSFPF